MKRITKVSRKPLLGILALMLMFCTPDFAKAATLDAEPVASAAQMVEAESVTASQLKAELVSVTYVDNNLKLYYTVKFTNESSVKITKAKVKATVELGETVVRNKKVTLNLAPGESKTVKFLITRVVDNPGKEGCSLKVKKFWYE